MAIPAPTDAWAKIISAIAWPVLIGFLVTRYRHFLRRFLETLASRLESDHIKLGPFEMTPNSNVIPLDPKQVDESTKHYTSEDIERIDKFFEFISDQDNYRNLAAWLTQHRPNLNVSDFLTEPDYAPDRAEASKAFFRGDTA